MILDSNTDVCYLSKLLIKREEGFNIAAQIIGHGVRVEFLENTRDIWARDYMPIQIGDDSLIGYEYAPDYLYNGGYTHLITNQHRLCNEMNIKPIASGLILDGGNVVKTSRGVIMVDKVFRENPLIPKMDLINRLENLFQAELILLPWDKSEIYGHADGIAREIEAGKLLLTDYVRYSKKYGREFENILSRYFDVELLTFNINKSHRHNWCYINFLRVGNKIFLPQLTPMVRENYSCESPDFESLEKMTSPEYHISGKVVDEDIQAVEQFRRLFKDCEIIPISCPKIVGDGGALNCISWNVKNLSACPQA